MWEIEKVVAENAGGRYRQVKVSGHPNADEHGYIYEHRVVMENYLGRLLLSNEVVHHINGNTKDNRPENLEVMLRGEHTTQHKLGSGNGPIMCTCAECGVTFYRDFHKRTAVIGTTNTFCSRRCNGKYQRRQQMLKSPHSSAD